MRHTLLTITLLTGLFATLRADDSSSVPSGFTPLFNGKDLTGWQIHGGKITSWAAEDGCLVVKKGGGGWLMTEKEYGDFELRLQFRVPKGGNSGVALRSPLKGNPAYTGMEIQILDDPWFHKNLPGFQPTQQTGAIYGLVPPSKQAGKPAGQWNTMHLTCKGTQIQVVLNGVALVDADLGPLREKHAGTHPGLLRTKGHIGLQDHGGRVEFRNLMIRELPSR